MSIPGSVNPLFLGAAGQATGGGEYQIERSVRFNSPDSAYLSRTPASSGNRKTWTLSWWMKLSALNNNDPNLFAVYTDANNRSGIFLDTSANYQFGFYSRVGGTSQLVVITDAVLRDHSAWYHCVISVDTTAATASDRAKIYINGVEQSLSTSTYPSQNYDTYWNLSLEHNVGRYGGATQFYDGLLADIHFIDGQALTPSSFGEFDTNGVWQPIDASGLTYGTNGFHLPFSDNSTAAALGTDTSSNGNTWTVNNISVTAGAGNDSLVDSPTNGSQVDTGVGGEVVGNYATLNPLASAGTFSNGNLEVSVGAAAETSGLATFGLPASGKWYWEVGITAIGSDSFVGISNGTSRTSLGSSYYYYRSIGGTFSGVPTPISTPSPGATYTTGDIISIAYNADAATLTFYKNNVIQGTFTGVPVGNYFPFAYGYDNANRTVNFGQRPFAYTAPSGFKALCTTNLPEPTIADGSTVMDVVTYTGNGSARSITLPGGFSPDLIWTKSRSSTLFHHLYDSVRGTNSNLNSNSTSGELTGAPYNDGVTAFGSNGYSLGAFNGLNENTTTYVAWAWDAGSSTVTNTEGSITSQVRANGYLSIVTYTGTGANATVGHGLGVAPGLIIVKQRSTASSNGNWAVQHQSLGATKNIILNSTAAADGPDAGYWNSTSPTSSVFSVGTYEVTNRSTATYVAYCFAPVAGYSAFGSYTGNGSATDGPFVYNNFLPKLILIKRTDTTSNWTMLDTSREGYNVDNDPLYPNLSNAEGTTDLLDINSNGFKLRTTDASVNANTGTYVYAAWASNPFQYSRAR